MLEKSVSRGQFAAIVIWLLINAGVWGYAIATGDELPSTTYMLGFAFGTPFVLLSVWKLVGWTVAWVDAGK